MQAYQTLLHVLQGALQQLSLSNQRPYPAIVQISVLSGGLSNQNYLVTTADKMRYVLRVNSAATSVFCSRAHEQCYWQTAANAKLAPALLWVSADEKYYLSEYVAEKPLYIHRQSVNEFNVAVLPAMASNTVLWRQLETQVSAAQLKLHLDVDKAATPTLLTGVPEGQSRFIDADKHLLLLLLQLRELPAGPSAITMTQQWQRYHQQMCTVADWLRVNVTEKSIPDTLALKWLTCADKLVARMPSVARWLVQVEACELRPQFCHRDLNPHNLLFNGKQLVCIDFEYAIASHPLCELATVLATHQLSASQQRSLTLGYLHQHPNVNQAALAAVPSAVDLYWLFACYWALLMAAGHDDNAVSFRESHQSINPKLSQQYLDWFDHFFPLLSAAETQPA